DEAETYYNKALAQSVQEQDKLAGLNEVAFYGTNYGRDYEGKIDLVDGEIETMMSKDAYKFTGSNAEKLEKIYLQQLLNFTLSPNEQFITSRRSGYPAFGSSLLPREEYAQVPVNTIPRRFDTGTPVVTDLMYDVLHEAFQRQGFTTTATGSNGAILHNERVWADKGAPEWGAGSK
ncbi:MAG: SusD/RagB family nutrient-binding outer membrane lipoprotein, partial [Bacteroidales bacterium]|nr:SusD/RagB family nutrient-binding outer membrane lipoprotein [Bacteroidales bacterium]